MARPDKGTVHGHVDKRRSEGSQPASFAKQSRNLGTYDGAVAPLSPPNDVRYVEAPLRRTMACACRRRIETLRPNIALTAAAVLIASLPSCGSTAPAKQQRAASTLDPAAAAASAPYSLSGARLTMTPEQVASSLKADGYRTDPGILSSSTGPSFEDLVQLRISGKAPKNPHEVPTIQLWRKGKETVRVWYAAYLSGARATMFQWQTEDALAIRRRDRCHAYEKVRIRLAA